MQEEIVALIKENNALLREIVTFIRSLQDPENVAKDDIKDLCMNIVANIIASDLLKREQALVDFIRNKFNI